MGGVILEEIEDVSDRDLGEKSDVFKQGRPNRILHDYCEDATFRSIEDSLELWARQVSSCCASAIATTSIVLSRCSLSLLTEVDDLGCQADDENDEKAGLRPEEEW